MGADSESLLGKVQNKIGTLLGGNPENAPLADEDPDIEYPEPLEQVQTEDGQVVMSKDFVEAEAMDQGDQGDK